MKGTIHYCLEDFIITYFGQEAWGKLMTNLGKETSFSYGTHISDDIDEVQSEYKSHRNLIDLFISLIKGLDLKFEDYTIIDKLAENLLHLTFGQSGQKRKTFKAYLEAKTS